MPQLASIALIDDNTVTHTFNPTSSNGALATLMTDEEVSRDLETTLKVQVSENKSRQRVNVKILKPVTALDTSGNTVVVDEALASLEFMFPHKMPDADRATLVQLAKASLSNAIISAVAEDGEGIW